MAPAFDRPTPRRSPQVEALNLDAARRWPSPGWTSLAEAIPLEQVGLVVWWSTHRERLDLEMAIVHLLGEPGDSGQAVTTGGYGPSESLRANVREPRLAAWGEHDDKVLGLSRR